MKRKHIIIYTPTSKDGDPNMDGTTYNNNNNNNMVRCGAYYLVTPFVTTYKNCVQCGLPVIVCLNTRGSGIIQETTFALSLLLVYNLITSTNETIIQLTERQIVMNSDNTQSFYDRAKEINLPPNLPHLQNLKSERKSKEQWKLKVKTAVNTYWTQNVQDNARELSTMDNLNIDALGIGKVHNMWSSLHSTISELRKDIVKCRLLTGTPVK